MYLLRWRSPADAVLWIAGDDSRLGDACTLFVHCDAGASDFDDGPADGSAGPVVEDYGVSGADIQVSVALVPIGVCGRGFVLAQVFGQPLLVVEGPAYWSAVTVHVGFLFALSVGWPDFNHTAGQAFDDLKVLAL